MHEEANDSSASEVDSLSSGIPDDVHAVNGEGNGAADEADGDGDETPDEAVGDPVPAPPLPPPAMYGPGFDPDHKYIWMTRTNRKATCTGCRAEIGAWQFRAVFLPHPDAVADKRRWKKLWWKYYHFACFADAASSSMLTSGVAEDCMMKGSESPEEYREQCDSARVRLTEILRSAG